MPWAPTRPDNLSEQTGLLSAGRARVQGAPTKGRQGSAESGAWTLESGASHSSHSSALDGPPDFDIDSPRRAPSSLVAVILGALGPPDGDCCELRVRAPWDCEICFQGLLAALVRLSGSYRIGHVRKACWRS